jgi:hypothetical protein
METRTFPEINDPKGTDELKGFLDMLSEFGFVYEFNDKKNRIKIKGEIDWCDDEFIGITDNNIELGVTVYKDFTTITLRRWFGEGNMEVRNVHLPFPVKFHYFHKGRELILDLDYRRTE